MNPEKLEVIRSFSQGGIYFSAAGWVTSVLVALVALRPRRFLDIADRCAHGVLFLAFTYLLATLYDPSQYGPDVAYAGVWVAVGVILYVLVSLFRALAPEEQDTGHVEEETE